MVYHRASFGIRTCHGIGCTAYDLHGFEQKGGKKKKPTARAKREWIGCLGRKTKDRVSPRKVQIPWIERNSEWGGRLGAGD